MYLSSSVLVSYYPKNDKGIKYFSIHQSLHLSLCRNLVSTPKMGPVETSSPRYLPLHIHDTSNAKCRIQESSVVLKDGPISDLSLSLSLQVQHSASGFLPIGGPSIRSHNHGR